MAKSAMKRARTEKGFKQATLKAMKDVHTKKNLGSASNPDDLFKQFGI